MDLEHEIDKEDQSEFFEKEPTGLVVGVKMKSLRKVRFVINSQIHIQHGFIEF